MSKINVYSSIASNAIKVFDANSTCLKPDNAILVTTGAAELAQIPDNWK